MRFVAAGDVEVVMSGFYYVVCQPAASCQFRVQLPVPRVRS